MILCTTDNEVSVRGLGELMLPVTEPIKNPTATAACDDVPIRLNEALNTTLGVVVAGSPLKDPVPRTTP